jgi:sec-independent protein translocase protein TatB
MFAFVFDSVSGGEWLVLLAVILIIVGPKNLPSAARKVGEIMSKLRRAADEFKRQLMTMDEEMKRAADDIKKEYIDIPDDSTDRAISDISDGSDEPYDDYEDDYEIEYDEPYEDEYDDYDEYDDDDDYDEDEYVSRRKGKPKKERRSSGLVILMFIIFVLIILIAVALFVLK